ncbi:MAG: phage tail tube protein, partial [Kiritimatiellia bacterium]
ELREADIVAPGTRQPQEPSKGIIQCGGDIVVPIDTATFPTWLALIFGAPTASVYKIGSAVPSFTLQRKISDGTNHAYFHYKGLKINTLAASFANNGELSLTLGCLGKEETKETTGLTATALAGIGRFLGEELTVTANGATGRVIQLDFNVANGLIGDRYVLAGDAKRAGLPARAAAVSGKLQMLLDPSTTDLAHFVAGGEGAISAALAKTAIGSYTFGFPLVVYGEGVKTIPGPQGMILDAPFTAFTRLPTYTDAITVTWAAAQ